MSLAGLQPVYLLELENRKEDAFAAFLSDRLAEIAGPIAVAHTLRATRRAVEDVLHDYLPLKFIISGQLIAAANEQRWSSSDLIRELNSAIFSGLDQDGAPQLSQPDRTALFEILKFQARLGRLADDLPDEHRIAFHSAFFEGFWPLQRIDICVSTVLLMAHGDMTAEFFKVPHWLCVVARSNLKHVDGAFFRNSPLLSERLASAGDTVTTEALERSLGL